MTPKTTAADERERERDGFLGGKKDFNELRFWVMPAMLIHMLMRFGDDFCKRGWAWRAKEQELKVLKSTHSKLSSTKGCASTAKDAKKVFLVNNAFHLTRKTQRTMGSRADEQDALVLSAHADGQSQI